MKPKNDLLNKKTERKNYENDINEENFPQIETDKRDKNEEKFINEEELNKNNLMNKILKPFCKSLRKYVALNLILKLVEKNLMQLQEGYAKPEDNRRYVPLSTVIGRRKIPASAAKTISKALAKLQGAGDIKEVELWRGLEILAEKYLGD